MKQKPIKRGGDDFNILAWWKKNSNRYKMLSRIVKNVLVTPISTVVSNHLSQLGGQILDQFKISLSPKMVQTLIYYKKFVEYS